MNNIINKINNNLRYICTNHTNTVAFLYIVGYMFKYFFKFLYIFYIKICIKISMNKVELFWKNKIAGISRKLKSNVPLYT